MADIIENSEIDKDTVGPEDIDKLFSKNYYLLTETAVSLKKSYINKLDVTKSLNIAVSLVDNAIEIYRLTNTSLTRVCRLSGHQKSLTDLRFSPQDDYLLYSVGHDGIKLWDTRSSGSCVQQYKNEENEERPYESMDVSCTGRVLCAGSQLVKDDAYIVFWDQRQLEPLGGYWNSHTDDITQVKFHKSKQEVLVTGSSDGLVNVFNIMEPTEDDALMYSLNVENSVERLSWLDDQRVACISQANDLQLCDVSNGDVVKTYSRDKITRSIKRSRIDDCYLVDCFISDGAAVLLAGSYGGTGDVLRSVTIAEKKMQPLTNFSGNKQVVRCCHYNQQREVLVTTGESGLIGVWAPGHREPPAAPLHHKLSASLSLHNNRHKPY